MYAYKGRLIVSAADVTRHLACQHLTSLDRMVAIGRVPAPETTDTTWAVAARRRVTYELQHLRELRAAGHEVAAMPGVEACGGLVAAAAATVAAVQAGREMIYRATLLDGVWRGHVDLLMRRDDRPSRFSSWSYDAAHSRPSHHSRMSAIIELAVNGWLLERMQGSPPEWLAMITDERQEERFAYVEAAAYAARARERLLATLALPPDVAYKIATSPCDHCHPTAG